MVQLFNYSLTFIFFYAPSGVAYPLIDVPVVKKILNNWDIER